LTAGYPSIAAGSRTHTGSETGPIVIDELMSARPALLARLRGPKHDAAGIPWEAVMTADAERLVVRR
jgi:hypothetical protein